MTLIGEEPTPEDTKLIFILKVVFIFVIFAVSLGFGILPAKVKSCGRNPRFMSMANAFSGGLFLAIALVHILPEVVENYDDYLHDHENPTNSTTVAFPTRKMRSLHGDGEGKFPLPFVLVFAGYTFILLVDKVMFDSHALFDHGHGHGHGHGHAHGHGHGHEHGSSPKMERLVSEGYNPRIAH